MLDEARERLNRRRPAGRGLSVRPDEKHRIDVRPDQVSQRDPNPKIGPTFEGIVIRFVLVSAFLVSAFLTLGFLGVKWLLR